MAQANLSPTSFTLRRKFEELPLFWSFHNGTPFRGGWINGEFVIEFDQSGEWIIADVFIETDNGKHGAEAEGRLVNLNADIDERFYLTVLDAIDHCYADHIPDWIDEELGWMNVRQAA